MKGYDTAFEICKKVNADEKIQQNNILIYPGGWKEDFFDIIIKDFDTFDDNVEYACQKVKESIDEIDEWTFIKQSFDEENNQVEIHSKKM